MTYAPPVRHSKGKLLLSVLLRRPVMYKDILQKKQKPIIPGTKPIGQKLYVLPNLQRMCFLYVCDREGEREETDDLVLAS